MMFAIYAVCIACLVLVGSENVAQAQNYNATTEVIESLLNNYDKRLRPNIAGAPVDVGVTMYVLSISSISDSDMDFTVDIYLRQYWIDRRLSFKKAPGLDKLLLGHDFGKMIWVPDTFIVNEKESFLHDVSVKNEFLKIDPSGEVVRSVRLSVTASCEMDLGKFPMDTQTCSLDIESYGHDASGIRYSWKEPNTSIGHSDSTLTTFQLVKVKEVSENLSFVTGNYSRLSAQFEFKRLWASYITQVYIPCIFLVILSWVSFWLKKSAYNVRLALCTLSLVLMTFGCQMLSTQIPRTSYNKAIDVYTGVSMTFIFVALMVFAYICNLAGDGEKDDEVETKMSKIDKFFRIAFPISFLLFNMFYWVFY